jgi:hypothetical protein
MLPLSGVTSLVHLTVGRMRDAVRDNKRLVRVVVGLCYVATSILMLQAQAAFAQSPPPPDIRPSHSDESGSDRKRL